MAIDAVVIMQAEVILGTYCTEVHSVGQGIDYSLSASKIR